MTPRAARARTCPPRPGWRARVRACEWERVRWESGRGGKALRQDVSEALVVPGECTVGFSEDIWI